MRHLFIINPKSFMLQGAEERMAADIRGFFSNYPQLEYDIHVTRWQRDAVNFTRRYVSRADSLVRVYAVGGVGTMFEVLNGVAGLPNVQVANLPMGDDNSMIYDFGGQAALNRFRSLRNLVFAPVITTDLLKCGNNVGINSAIIGVEAMSFVTGINLQRVTHLQVNRCYKLAAMWHLLYSECVQWYQVELDGVNLDGSYVSISIANGKHYAAGLPVFTEARIDDGLMDLYLIRRAPLYLIPTVIDDYHTGQYAKWPAYINHYQGRSLTISSNKVMAICFEGELFYDNSIHFENIPRAVDFVCPPAPSAKEAAHV